MTSPHMVEIIDFTAGVRLRCVTCPWSARIESGAGRPAVGDEYAQLRSEAVALRVRHAWQEVGR